MAFTEYWDDHRYWQNPFDRIDPSKRIKERRRDVLQEDEILKLFMPCVITDTLERAVAVAMFWAGLRRAEIFGLKTNDLDWKTPKLNINHAWKQFGSVKKEASAIRSGISEGRLRSRKSYVLQLRNYKKRTAFTILFFVSKTVQFLMENGYRNGCRYG